MLSVLCLVHSTLTLCTLCKTDELFAAHARTCSLLNARCDASVDVDVAARFSAQAARMRIIKRQRRRRRHHHRRSCCSPSSSYSPSSPSSSCQRAAQRRLAAFAFLILHFSIALQLVGVACTSTECAAVQCCKQQQPSGVKCSPTPAAGACVFAWLCCCWFCCLLKLFKVNTDPAKKREVYFNLRLKPQLQKLSKIDFIADKQFIKWIYEEFLKRYIITTFIILNNC